MASPALVLIPGLLCDDAVWSAQSAALSLHVSCHTVGHAAVDSIEMMAQHLLASAPAGPLAVAGHSMGGRVALEVVRQAPERVVKLALLDTGGRPLPPGVEGDAERHHRSRLMQLARHKGMEALGREWAKPMLHSAAVAGPVFDAVVSMVMRDTVERFEAHSRALLTRPDAGPVLGRIRCTTLVMCGRQDTWAPVEQHQGMADLIHGATLRVVENAGHMITMEQPDRVIAALKEWVESRA